MRLALVYDAVYPWVRGGGEAHNDELARRLVGRGHEVHLAGMKWWPGPRRRERDGVHLHGICPAMSLYQGQGRRRVAPPLAFGAAATAWLASHRFDLVDVCAFPYFSALGGRLVVGRRPWTLTWFEVWGDYWRQYLGRPGEIGRQVEIAVARGCPFHIAHSPLTAARLRALVPQATVRMIPSGIEVEGPTPLPSREPRRIAWCGRAVDFKNLPLLLQALATLTDLDWSLEVIGDGPCLSAWQAEAVRLGLESRITWHGFLEERAQVHRLLAGAGILVQTSLREGMGKTAFEAMALGCALVCVEHPEVATTGFLEDGQSALLVPAGDAQGLGRRLRALLGDEELRARLQRGGRVVAAEQGWERIVDRVLAHYDEVAGARVREGGA